MTDKIKLLGKTNEALSLYAIKCSPPSVLFQCKSSQGVSRDIKFLTYQLRVSYKDELIFFDITVFTYAPGMHLSC